MTNVNPFSTAPSPIFIPIPHFVFENASSELTQFIKSVPKHKLLADSLQAVFSKKFMEEILQE
jgi:hypothetical protein